jgi:Protein of unknown function (DUF2934)
MTNENNNHSTEYDDWEYGHRVHHPPTLDEIQLRAYRVHYRHGGAFGGYTLEDWLEAERELSDEPDSPDGC